MHVKHVPILNVLSATVSALKLEMEHFWGVYINDYAFCSMTNSFIIQDECMVCHEIRTLSRNAGRNKVRVNILLKDKAFLKSL